MLQRFDTFVWSSEERQWGNGNDSNSLLSYPSRRHVPGALSSAEKLSYASYPAEVSIPGPWAERKAPVAQFHRRLFSFHNHQSAELGARLSSVWFKGLQKPWQVKTQLQHGYVN